MGNTTIITSNRDEKRLRPVALLPQRVKTSNGVLYYPVDAKAGGTWFIVNDKGDVGVLLNGAYEKHLPKESYRQSRGTILPALFSADNILYALSHFDFKEIENCTLVLYVDGKLYECIWDGETSNITKLDETQKHIWSSVTLYNSEMIADRKHWFNEFNRTNTATTQEEFIHFHTNTGKGNDVYGLKINRDNTMLTVSITSVAITEERSILQYKDCLHEKQFAQVIDNNIIA